MSPEHPTPGAETTPPAAAEKPGARPSPSSDPAETRRTPASPGTPAAEPGSRTPSGPQATAEKKETAPTAPAAAPAAAADPVSEPASEPAQPSPGQKASPGTGAAAESAAPETGGTPTAGTGSAAETSASKAAKGADASEAGTQGVALAAAVGTRPGTRTMSAADKGRPRTPVLAGAAFVGAALVAIPVLLMGSANDEEPRRTSTAPVAGSADTVLNPETAPAALDDYVAAKPSPSPAEPKKAAPPKVVPAPPPPAPEPRTSAPEAKAEEKPKASAKPKPKAAPKPNWGTQTVSAPSSIGVGQSWATNRIRLTMQQDGNLVVYNEHDKPIWAAMTFGQNHRAIFQPDGNLVIHNGEDRPIWASKTHDFGGARMVLRSDGKVVIEHNGRVVWST
ncbi:mannose-binding protein [Streptomyces sp. NPDC101181]|uniref:mannose-binding protein n=1 Tax=Streptomyces sp. NPDC101181 TaxID=3366125 RepID=UPI0037FEF17B